MARLLAGALLAGAALAACAPLRPVGPALPALPAPQGDPSAIHYRCDDSSEFTVHFVDDSAAIDMPAAGREQLLRDAGGLTPQQTVYSNSRYRAQFGLGERGNEALLRSLSKVQETRCVRSWPL